MKEIIGRVPVSVNQDNDTITMLFEDGSCAMWYHEQDCCERVVVEDVTGDWSDLYGHPLLVAEERTSNDFRPADCESCTWTFYTFRSIGGSVDVRWFGESNGYYSEAVNFAFEEKE